MLWKLEGLGERDLRWPHTPTGTNLLGLVKHLAGVEFDYFGETFGRPSPVSLPWMGDDAEDNADMWATPEESAAEIVALYRQAWAASDETIAALRAVVAVREGDPAPHPRPRRRGDGPARRSRRHHPRADRRRRRRACRRDEPAPPGCTVVGAVRRPVA